VFDRPEWWQVLILITPISLVIYGLRWREARLTNTLYKALSPVQRGFALLHYLPPGVSAEFWSKLEGWEQESYLKAGQSIRGSGKYLIGPLVKEVVKMLAQDKSKPPSTESNDPLEKLALAAEFCKPQLFKVLREKFPAEREAAAE
jgi:hypothetical protein